MEYFSFSVLENFSTLENLKSALAGSTAKELGKLKASLREILAEYALEVGALTDLSSPSEYRSAFSKYHSQYCMVSSQIAALEKEGARFLGALDFALIALVQANPSILGDLPF